MPLMQTVTIINKSGKVVSTGKHLVNIFKDAKDAYDDKKAELRAENQRRIQYKLEQKLLEAQEETRSVASHRSHRSRRSRSGRKEHSGRRSAPTERPLGRLEEEIIVDNEAFGGSLEAQLKPEYDAPPRLARRHTDFAYGEAYGITDQRRRSEPDLNDKIDMNLAYGDVPMALLAPDYSVEEQEKELRYKMSKLDSMLLEAQCLQFTATRIIHNLQANPEAMAAVALTLAEISSLVTKMSPSILGSLKAASPAIFGLLASPQFLIAGGVAFGVTVVMFGGFKIVKRLQAGANAPKRAMEMPFVAPMPMQMPMPMSMPTAPMPQPEAPVYTEEEEEEEVIEELSAIENWRRGIADVEAQSVATSVDGELISPEAARQTEERIRERRREERAPSVASARTSRSKRTRTRSVSGESALPVRSKTAPTIMTLSDVKEEKKKEKRSKQIEPAASSEMVWGRKSKKSQMSVLFKKAEKSVSEKEKVKRKSSHRPQFIEV